jgi:hypothetical protein
MCTEKQRRPPFMNDTTMALLRLFIKHDIPYLTISIIATKYISNPQSIKIALITTKIDYFLWLLW